MTNRWMLRAPARWCNRCSERWRAKAERSATARIGVKGCEDLVPRLFVDNAGLWQMGIDLERATACSVCGP